MTNYNSTPTDRIDTTRTLVAVKPGDDRSDKSAAAAHVRKTFAEMAPRVLAIWRTPERDTHGWPVYEVEWEAGVDVDA